MAPLALHQHSVCLSFSSSSAACGNISAKRLLSDNLPVISLRSVPVGVAVASSTEPKWKQKLAAADERAEATRRATAQAQVEYKKRQEQIRRQQDSGNSDIGSLNSLEYISYLTEEGKIADCSKSDAKASVYAIFDDVKALQYVGVSRAVSPSMKLHFARVPSKCFYVKVQHLTKPSRSILESIREKWISENGSSPPGNDNGEQQNIWENPRDCKPLMTDEEKKIVEEAAPGPPTAKALKNVARRIEAGLFETFKARNCTEPLRFDPKLKDNGLLDLKNLDPPKAPRKPDTAVPTTDVKPAPVGAASA
ncbi:unnamed protein product [Calypogeia fissa]